jgi:predicted dehydrogenase
MAGKHVLCGKPLCANAREAVAMQRAAEDAGKVCIEAFHALCHPVCKRVLTMIAEGTIGMVESISVRYKVELSQYDARMRSKIHEPTPPSKDYRLQRQMGGGVTMDLGCYCVAMVRAIMGEQPKVVRAKARVLKEDPEVDVAMDCDLELPSGASAHFECSFDAGQYAQPVELQITGKLGQMNVKGFFAGHKANAINIEKYDDVGVKSREIIDDPSASNTRDSFYYQLMSFVDEVSHHGGQLSEAGMPWAYTRTVNRPVDSIDNMAVIVEVYRAAGWHPRPAAHPPPAPYASISISKL